VRIQKFTRFSELQKMWDHGAFWPEKKAETENKEHRDGSKVLPKRVAMQEIA
jgi:hypothetical protein